MNTAHYIAATSVEINAELGAQIQKHKVIFGSLTKEQSDDSMSMVQLMSEEEKMAGGKRKKARGHMIIMTEKEKKVKLLLSFHLT